MSKWSAANLPDLTGRSAVVTGASSGIGLVAARELPESARTSCSRFAIAPRAKLPPGRSRVRPRVRELDLADLASVQAFASGWSGDLDLLINNAGIMQVPEGRTRDGFELQLGTNHLGHFALTSLLRQHLTGRVVTVTSQLHSQGRLDLEDPNWQRRDYKPLQAYRDSKQANVLFTLELQRRLAADGSGVHAISAHPGVAKTHLADHVGGFQGWVNARLSQTVEAGAASTLYAVTADVPSNAYVGPDGFAHLRGHPSVAKPPKAARDTELAQGLWELSARLTGADLGTSNFRDAAAHAPDTP
jgi:NAD(P)-dependent dehydrogenase (short-subunit alcohol dehydrogenase family)